MNHNKVCVIGQGYVGLTLSAVMAQSGYEVLGLEKDEEKLRNLKRGKPHFEEPELATTIATQLRLGNLSFGKDTSHPAASDCSVYIVAVGTPLREDKSPNSDIVFGAIDSVLDVLSDGDLVVLRSTVPVGTTEKVASVIETATGFVPGEDVYLAHAPERTLQGQALEELRHLPQIIGGYDDRSTTVAEQVFKEFVQTSIHVESSRAAELIKLFDNTYRDVNIALGNAFGEIARSHGLDGQGLIDTANKGYDRNDIKQPGIGVGGGCLPKDPYLLASEVEFESETLDLVEDLIMSARQLNEHMPYVATEMIEDAFADTDRKDEEPRSLVLGVAFKGQPETNDIRHTPAGPVIEFLSEFGPVDAFDPCVEDHKIESLGATVVSPDASEKLSAVFDRETYELVAITNNNPRFRELDLSRVSDRMTADPILVDGWGLYDSNAVEKAGFEYVGVGRSR